MEISIRKPQPQYHTNIHIFLHLTSGIFLLLPFAITVHGVGVRSKIHCRRRRRKKRSTPYRNGAAKLLT